MRAVIANAALAAILSGCAGSTEPLDQIKGTAPGDGSCSVVVTDSSTDRVLSTQTVRGNFSVGFGLGDNFPRKVHVAGVCNGKTVTMLRGVVPGAIGVTDLGAVSP